MICWIRAYAREGVLSGYTATHLLRETEFGRYRFAIARDGVQVAEFQHSHRNEDWQIRIGTSGAWLDCDDILEGGGPLPLAVNKAGAKLLDRLLAEAAYR